MHLFSAVSSNELQLDGLDSIWIQISLQFRLGFTNNSRDGILNLYPRRFYNNFLERSSAVQLVKFNYLQNKYSKVIPTHTNNHVTILIIA